MTQQVTVESLKGDVENVVGFLAALKRAIPGRFDGEIESLSSFLVHVGEHDGCLQMLATGVNAPVSKVR